MFKTLAACVVAICAGLLLCAQSPATFPPGVFLGRGALDAPSGGGGGFTGPLDAVSGATLCWSLRACSSSVASSNGAIINVLLTTNSHTCDILAASNGGLGNTANCSTGGDNGQAAATFCGSNCHVETYYDQTGNGNTQQQTTSANQAGLTFSCSGSLPCSVFTTSTNYLDAIVNIAAPLTFSLVMEHTGSSSSELMNCGSAGITVIGNDNTGPNLLRIGAGTNLTVTAADNALHSIQVLFSGVASTSSANVDGTTSSSLNAGTGDCSGGHYVSLGVNLPWTGDLDELILYPSGLSGTNQTALCHNQFSYWGTATSC